MPYSLLSRWLKLCKDPARAALTTGTAVAVIGTLGLLAVTHAAGLGLKPGLWDVRLVRQIVDGHDVSAQLTESIAKEQTALAKLTPEARKHAQAMLNPAGANPGSNANFRICVSPAMGASDLPIMDKDGSCQPVMLSRSGNHTAFRIDCMANGTHIQGQGEAVSTGDVITSRSDITARAADGSTHTMHDETRMQYISADCGNLRPPR